MLHSYVCSQLVVDNEDLQSAKLTLQKQHKSTHLYDMLYMILQKSPQFISTHFSQSRTRNAQISDVKKSKKILIQY